MIITVTIMAHPKRQKEADLLLAKLEQYPFAECGITWDKKNEEWDTGERSLRAGIKKGADWHIVLQDDAIIGDDFYNNVIGALSHVPDRTLVSFYTGTVRPFRTRVASAVKRANGVNWLKSDLLYWGVGIAIPTSHIEQVLDFISDRQEKYDYRIGWAYQRNRLPVFYTNPSLVDHDDYIPTLAGAGQSDYAQEPRVAHNFHTGGLIEWNSDVIDI